MGNFSVVVIVAACIGFASVGPALAMGGMGDPSANTRKIKEISRGAAPRRIPALPQRLPGLLSRRVGPALVPRLGGRPLRVTVKRVILPRRQRREPPVAQAREGERAGAGDVEGEDHRAEHRPAGENCDGRGDRRGRNGVERTDR